MDDWSNMNFSIERMKGSGRKSKITERIDRIIIRIVNKYPDLSCQTIASNFDDVSRWLIYRRLKSKGFRSEKIKTKIFLNEYYEKARVILAMKRCLWREPNGKELYGQMKVQ